MNDVAAVGAARRMSFAAQLSRAARIYGRMVARFLSSKSTAIPDGLVVLRNEEAESAIKETKPAGDGLLASPQRLVLAPGLPAGFPFLSVF